MLIDKSIKVEQEVDDLLQQLVITVKAAKAKDYGTLLGELLKFQQILSDVRAFPGDYEESFDGTLRAVLNNAADLAAALLGKTK